PKTRGAMSPHGVLAFSADDISGFSTLTGNELCENAPRPFSIRIDRTNYSTIAMSTNGWIEFGGNTSGNSDPTNDCLPTSAHTNPFLAAFWDDMVTAGSSTIRYGTVGTAPDRTFLVDYFLDTVTS